MAAQLVLIAPPPKNTPFFDTKGRIQQVWVAWMGSIPSAAVTLKTDIDDVVLTSLQKAANLSDLPDAAAARLNLGLSSAAIHSAADFDAAGAAAAVLASSLQKSANLSDLPSSATARTNLGLGTAATHAATDFDAAGTAGAALQKSANLSDVANTATARSNLGAQASLGFTPENVANRGAAAGYAPLVSSAVPIANGGTAATSAAAALANLVGSWSSWTPTVTGSGSMSISSLTVVSAQYIKLGPLLFFCLTVTFITGGTPSTDINISLPVAFGGLDFAAAYGSVLPASGAQQNIMAFISASNVLVRLSPSANWTAGTQNGLRVAGFYHT